jgi:hypothetical protein
MIAWKRYLESHEARPGKSFRFGRVLAGVHQNLREYTLGIRNVWMIYSGSGLVDLHTGAGKAFRFGRLSKP